MSAQVVNYEQMQAVRTKDADVEGFLHRGLHVGVFCRAGAQ